MTPFCTGCGNRFEIDDQFCASCGAGRFVQLDDATPTLTSSHSPQPTAETLFPGYAPAPWSTSGTVLMDRTGHLAVYAASKADAQAALVELRVRKRSLSVDEYGTMIGPIETAMQRLDQLIRAANQDQS